MYKRWCLSDAEQFCDYIFRTFDTEKKGYFDFNEFLLAIDNSAPLKDIIISYFDLMLLIDPNMV